MKNLLNPTTLRRWIDWFIQKQPVHLQVWVAVNPDDLFGSPVSYQFSYSYVAGIADAPQQTYSDKTDFRSGGTVAAKQFLVILPYVSGKPIPRKGDMVILYRLDGTIYARAWTVWVNSYDAGTVGVNQNTLWKTELMVSVISSN